MRKKMGIGLMLLFVMALGAGAMTLGSAWVIRRAAAGRVFTDTERLPTNDVGLVLGTSKRTKGGRYDNAHFYNRIDAAAALYRSGRVHHLLLSGDNGTRGYDEPTDMRDALLARGVPADALTLDYAGFRTLDSIVRARKVFGQTRLTIITDPFHAARALFLARHYGIDAVAFPSKDVALRYSTKSKTREYLANVKACLDLYVLRTQPKFLGAEEPVRVTGR
jgi:SanA protein